MFILADSTLSQWLIDVSRELPSAQLDGFDISDDQYPNGVWLPPNISLRQLDIFKPVPQDLEDLYDLAHVQLFLCVVPKVGPAKVLKEIYKMLSRSSF